VNKDIDNIFYVLGFASFQLSVIRFKFLLTVTFPSFIHKRLIMFYKLKKWWEKNVRNFLVRRPKERFKPLEKDPYKKNDFYFIGMKKVDGKEI